VKGKITVKFPKILRETRPTTSPSNQGFGKRFEYGNSILSFSNFTASEIISILAAMHGSDEMNTRFGDGK
jgi:hypothetical protein